MNAGPPICIEFRRASALSSALSNADSRNTCRRTYENAAACDGWCREAIQLSYVERSSDLPGIHIQRVKCVLRVAIHCMTTDYWRAENSPGRFPTQVHPSVRVYANLSHPVDAGNKDGRAYRGRSSK